MTAVGGYPAQALRYANRICISAEAAIDYTHEYNKSALSGDEMLKLGRLERGV